MQEKPIYKGLNWSDRNKSRIFSTSQTTGARYIVESTKDTTYSVKFGWPDRPGKPHIVVGMYNNPETSILAAERHDFKFWNSTISRNGGCGVFIGSGNGQFISELGSAGEEISELLIESTDKEKGKTFQNSASFFPSKKLNMKQEKNGQITLSLSISPDELPRWIMESKPGKDILLGAVDMEIPEVNDWEDRGKQALKRSFILPQDNSFQNWMLYRYDKWKLISTAIEQGTSDGVESAVAETLKRLLSCPSRSELLRNRDAIENLEKIDKEFYTDLSNGFT